jgi:PKD repeat protein
LEPLENRIVLNGTVLIDEDFEDGNADGFDYLPPESPFTRIVEGDSYGPGNKAYQIIYAEDEFGPILIRDLGPIESIEVSFATKLPDGIPIEGVERQWGGLKLSRIARGSGQPYLNRMDDQLAFYAEGFDGPGSPALWQYTTFVYSSDLPGYFPFTFHPDEWFHVRYYAKFNTPGQQDGIWMIWLNGELRQEAYDVHYADTIEERIDNVWVGGNLSLGGDRPDFPFRRLLDDVRVVVNGDIPDSGSGSSNQRPVARIDSTPANGIVPHTILLDARGSTDDGTITRYLWEFGDGTSAEGQMVEKTFFSPGTYSVRLTVWDDGSPSLSGTTTRQVIVQPALPQLTIEDRIVLEGDIGWKRALVTVRLDSPSDRRITVRYDMLPGTASVGQDFRRTQGILTFPRGTQVRRIPVWIRGDRVIEPDEQFYVRLFSAANAVIARDTATVTIWDQDFPRGTILRPGVALPLRQSGLNFRYFHGDWDNLPNFSQLTPLVSGSTSNFLLEPLRDWSFGYRFTGFIYIARPGIYTFSTTSDDGSRLMIGNRIVVDNDGLHSAQTRSGTIALRRGFHPIRVDYFERGGDELLEVQFSGPGLVNQLIPDDRLFIRGRG